MNLIIIWHILYIVQLIEFCEIIKIKLQRFYIYLYYKLYYKEKTTSRSILIIWKVKLNNKSHGLTGVYQTLENTREHNKERRYVNLASMKLKKKCRLNYNCR